ncbi:YnfC family lipoprotein [Klebsiella oxytoca]|uniref:YnfC family lipoprotein n=1 Tax=Klebsiella oxytoca TaxID=571 RepID=UPI000D0080D8|nr:YnfC family lipoprotein [Klebsiella oxytoca]AVL82833.1 YnfC family lipoprotein [Klebsiella oxytoca]EKX5081617.1 YnfC family lipoprotein [Klebsiella oxytoca]EKX5093631.1 YnfC family lipoprotein [Klebsiella oxytoca]EKX5098260.1 YnfC family lipoprotein [Klebsiella oxytoca]ELQ8989220.1 YnfC family lipoprotein [Klebsiella oxytoca]
MKKRFLLLLAVGALSACDEKEAPQAFTPEMASFSNEFEFDPLRGPVKEFSQTLYDEHDEVVKWVKGRLSSEGCFDLLAFEDLENKTGAALVLDANYYLDAQSQEKRLRLQGKCQLAEMPSAGVSWETDDNGFVVTARGKESTATYRYDSEGYPLGKTTTAKGERFTVSSTPSSDPRKKMDYTAVSIFNDRTLGNVSQTCDYDDYDNPVSCELKVVDDSVQPALIRHYTIKSTIDYY